MPTTTARPATRSAAGMGTATAAALLTGAGLLTIVVGTFLPWLRSGSRERNSYQADGVISRLLDPQGLIHPILSAWPFVALGGGLAVALWALGLRIAAAGLALVVAVVAAIVAIGALTVGGNDVAQVSDIGPVITVIGAAFVPIALLMHTAQMLRAMRSAR
jgi:hypothetical protein